MSFGGFGSQGQIRYALIVDDANATQKIGTFKTSLTQLGPATQAVNQNMATMGNSFKTTSTGVTTLTTSMKTMQSQVTSTNTQVGTFKNTMAQIGNQNTQTANTFKAGLAPAIKQSGDALAGNTRALQQNIAQHKTLGSSIKGAFTQFSGLATGMAATASGALQMAAGFRDFNDAQIAVERVTRKNSLAQEALGKAQDKLNALQAKGVTSGKEYEQAQLDVNQAQKMVEIQTQLLGEAQERMFDSQTQFAVSVIPTVLGAIGSLGSAFKNTEGLTSKLRGVFAAMSGAADTGSLSMKGLGAAALGTAGPILAVVAAAKALIDIVPQMRKLQDAAKTIEDTNATIRKTLEAEKTQIEALLQSFDITNFASYSASLARLGFSEKDLADKRARLAEINKLLARNTKELDKTVTESTGSYDTLGNKIDGTTKLMAGFNKDTTEVIDILTQLHKVVDPETTSAFQALDETFNATLNHEQLGTVRKDFDDIVKLMGSASHEITALDQSMNEWAATTTATHERLIVTSETLDVINDVLNDLPASEKLWENEIQKNKVALDQRNKLIKETEEGLKNMDDVFQTLEDSERKAAENLNKLNADWSKFALEFNRADLDLAGALGMDKLKEGDKIFKDMVKDLPKKLEKELKGNIKAEFKIEETKKGVKMFIQSIMEAVGNDRSQYIFDPNLHVDKKKAIAYGKEILSEIKNIPDADTKAAGKNLADAISKGDMGAIRQAITDVLKTLDPKPIPVYLVPDPTKSQKEADKLKLTAPTTATITSIDPGKSKFVAKMNELSKSAPSSSRFSSGGTSTAGYVPVTGVITNVVYETGPTVTTPTAPRSPEALAREEEARKKLETGDGKMFQTTITGAQKAQTALANLATQGSNSISMLAKNIGVHTKSINTYLARTVPQAAQRSQTGLANMANEGSNSMSTLQKSMANHTKSINTYLGRTIPIAAQKSQTSLANLANEGSNSASQLQKNMASSMNSIVKSVQGAQRAVISLIKSIGNMRDKEITVTTNFVEKHKVVWTQHGFHGVVSSPTIFGAGEAGPEYVSVTPIHGGGASSTQSFGGGRGGSLTVNLTNVISDRETTRTFRREIGKDIYRFGPI